MSIRLISRLFFCVMSILPGTSALGEATYPSGVESIVSAMAGIVTGADQVNTLGRSSDRLQIIRVSLAKKLEMNYSSTAKFRLEELRSENVLCNARGDHAARAADRAYLSTVAAQITTVAAPGQISTLFDAIGVIFKHYSIEVSAQNPSNSRQKVIDRCTNDVPRFAGQYYGAAAPADKADQLALEADQRELADVFSSLTSLHDAINAIVSPLARAWDRWQRDRTITEFLVEHKQAVKTSAIRVARVSAGFASSRKMKALGQFSEGLAALRSREFDLSKLDHCKAIPAGQAAYDNIADPSDKKRQLRVPTDPFMSCYATIWKIIADEVVAILKTADDYDQLADAISGDELQSAKSIGEKLERLGQRELDLKSLWEETVRLVAFGKMLQEAFSKEHRDKLKAAIEGLVKAI